MKTKTTLPVENERKQYEMLLLSVREVKNKSGDNTYCIIDLQPSAEERKISAKVWGTTKEQIISSVPEMTVAALFLTGNVYNGNLQYIADTITPGTGRPEDYRPSSKINGKTMYDYTTGLVTKHCAGHPAFNAFLSLYKENRERLLYYPAAMGVHHAELGGLIMHSGTCACVSHKIASAIAPENVRQIQSKGAVETMNAIHKMLNNMVKNAQLGPVTEEAMKIFRTFHTTHQEEAVKKYIAMTILHCVYKSYPILDADLLFGACLLRGASIFTDDPMAGLIGTGTCDMRIVKKHLEGTGLDGETVRLLAHCMIVNDDTDRSPVIPEAYLIMYAEKLADEAVRHASADDASFSVQTLIIAAALHDIGKIRELDAAPLGKTEYDTEGNMYGHTAIGVEMFLDALDRTGTGIDAQSAAVAHCIASHPGKKEWGALAEPATFEAVILSLVDRIDSRMNIFERCTQALPEGGKDESVRRYIGNVVYRPLKTA